MTSYLDDYDYDDINDPHFTIWEDHWDSTIPAGSGAGESTLGACANEWDEYDVEVEREDEP